MKFKLEIDMDNAAFDVCNGDELSDILDKVSNIVNMNILSVGDRMSIKDCNGNNVGKWEVVDD